MDNNSKLNPFLFYLLLEDTLPSTFFTFQNVFRDLGFILVPVKMDQLQTIVSAADQSHVIVISSVINFKELKLYNTKVRKLLKFVLKSKRITFMNLSSFSDTNESRTYFSNKNYFYLRYPVNARTLAAKIGRYYELKAETNVRWPGGKRSSLLSGSL